MTTLAVAVGSVVVVLGALHRPRSTRKAPSRTPTSTQAPLPGPNRIGAIGAFLAKASGRRLDGDSRHARQLGAAVFAIPLLALSPAVGVMGLLWALALPVVADRREAQRHERRVLHELPEIIDLLAVAVAGGRTVPLAIDDAVSLVPGAVTDALARCRRRAGMGRRLADELETLPTEVSELVRPLVRALVAAERYGSPIGPSLDIAAADVRLRRRRAAERRARQLPVKMLFPLVVCVLPAFALLTVVPVLVDAFSVINP